jgi:hypothetical protein
MPQKTNNPSDPDQRAGSPIPQEQDDELEMAGDDEDSEDEDFDDEDDSDENEGVEEA